MIEMGEQKRRAYEESFIGKEVEVLVDRIVHGFVPLSEMFGYSTDLRSRTHGRGNYSMFFDHYEKVPKNVQEKILDAHLAAQNK